MLEFSNVDVSVSKNPILSDISLRLEKGKITVIVGPNGCGKTTLLQTLNGISTVTKGDINIDGTSILELAPRERAKRLSFMPQLRENAPSISVKGLVEHGRFPYMGFSRKMTPQDKESVEKAIDYVQLSEYKHNMVNELSGGLQQRVYLAMQLAQESEYMVMDEPMTYLDFAGQRDMCQIIRGLREQGRTIILVMHDLNQALQIADSVVVMKDRKVIYQGTPKECIDNNKISEVYNCSIETVEVKGTTQYILI